MIADVSRILIVYYLLALSFNFRQSGIFRRFLPVGAVAARGIGNIIKVLFIAR